MNTGRGPDLPAAPPCTRRGGGIIPPGQGVKGAVATLAAGGSLLQRVGIDFDRVLDGHAVALWASMSESCIMQAGQPVGDHFRTAGDDVVALALTDFAGQIVVGKRETAAATAATVGFLHLHEIVIRVHADKVHGAAR